MALSKPPDEDLVHALIEKQLRKCRAFPPAFVLYDAAPEGHPSRTTIYFYQGAQAKVLKL